MIYAIDEKHTLIMMKEINCTVRLVYWTRYLVALLGDENSFVEKVTLVVPIGATDVCMVSEDPG